MPFKRFTNNYICLFKKENVMARIRTTEAKEHGNLNTEKAMCWPVVLITMGVFCSIALNFTSPNWSFTNFEQCENIKAS